MKYVDNFFDDDGSSMKNVLKEAKSEMVKKRLMQKNYLDYYLYVNPGFTVAPHIEFLCWKMQEVFEGKTKRLMVNMPVRRSKSEIGSKNFPSWWMGHRPDNEIMMVSNESSLANQFSRRNRANVKEYGNELFDVGLSKEKASVDEWALEGHKGSFRSIGYKGGATGRGADLLLIDDIVKNAGGASGAESDAIWEEYQRTLENRLSPDGAIIIIMTRWEDEDLCGRLLERDGKLEDGGVWDVVSLPEICEDEENDLLGRKEGEVLWPDRFPKEDVYKLRDSYLRPNGNKHAWYATYQQTPEKAEKFSGFDVSASSYYQDLKYDDSEYDYVLSIDATFKGTKGSDKVGMGVFAVLTDLYDGTNNYYLVDGSNEVMDFKDTKNTVRDFMQRYPIRVILIEDKANGPAIQSNLRDEFDRITMYEPRGTKHERLQLAMPFISLMHFKTELEVGRQMRKQIKKFGKEQEKDLADTWSMMINWYEENSDDGEYSNQAELI